MEVLYMFLKSQVNLESLVVAVTGYLIVFTALVLLFWFFSIVPRILSFVRRRHPSSAGQDAGGDSGISGEETAAIAMALSLYLDEAHDEESGVLTIKRISKTYSPWSSKIYAVRNQFNRQ